MSLSLGLPPSGSLHVTPKLLPHGLLATGPVIRASRLLAVLTQHGSTGLLCVGLRLLALGLHGAFAFRRLVRLVDPGVQRLPHGLHAVDPGPGDVGLHAFGALGGTLRLARLRVGFPAFRVHLAGTGI